MAYSIRILLILAVSILAALPTGTDAQSNLTCYSSFQFVPSNYSTCNTLRDNSTLAWSLSYNNTEDPTRKYFKGLFVSVAKQPGGWVSWGLNLFDQKLMQNSSVLACYNTFEGPKLFQLWLDDTDYDGVYQDNTKDRLNVTSKNCFVQSTIIGGVPVEKIYIQFEITLGPKAQFINVYGKGLTSSDPTDGAASTAILEHHDHDARHDRVLRDFRETSDPGLGLEPKLPSPPSPPVWSPPPLRSSPPPLRSPPPPKKSSPPPKKSPPPPKKSPPPPKKSPPPPKKSPPPPKKSSPPPKKSSPPPTKSSPPYKRSLF